MDHVATGAIAMGYAVAGLFFLRFWRDTRDRLFGLFALALFVLAVNRAAFPLLGLGESQGEHTYWVRLTAFTLILAAIIDKNRSRQPPRP